ncbi:FAD-binding oxidoreductase [Abyssibius alkaniclasticus]|uniref:FAD-binding oxidoreductase n=1 Tax=Abyssibius alkaniclasticus TaxID=2881234 RepID=UPI00236434F0|nr:FAD-binding oxidoreductase [Abyssibius alkaniclasticus]UPH71452.1 FAD-binding oxidoreductase [Abyssibius alkaniclasticus]
MAWKAAEHTAWGRALRSPSRIARPERQSVLHDIMASTPAPAIGAARSYGDAALNDGGHLIDMTRLDRLLEFNAETGRVRAEAGVRLSDLLQIFGPQGWMPAVLPGTAFVTVGGAIASDVHGKNHHERGSFGQYVASIELLDANGQVLTLSEVENPTLFRATIGGMGQTGVILSAELRLMRCPGGKVRLTRTRIPDLEAFLDAFETSTAPYSVGWIDATARGAKFGRGVFEEGTLVEGAFRAPKAPRRLPFYMGGLLVSRPVVKTFNAAYLRRASLKGRSRIRPVQDMLFPLDGIAQWNRLYGRRGFHQFQCVLPQTTAEITLPRVLEAVVNSGQASPLSVLKKLGSGRAGYMSFPMAGVTLAVDIRAGRGALPLLHRLNTLVAEAGGRVYLAKDSALTPDLLAAMYPDLDRFRDVLAKADPKGVFRTDLARRLNLCGDLP